jgi:thiamine-phosphate pyrophosphorylase
VNDRRERLARARLYLVCDARSDDFLDAVLRGGVDIVQLRAKGAGDASIVSAGRRVRVACERYGALFILNDRPDLVTAVDADGVHVGQDDMAVSRARELVGPDRLVGVSTHSPAQIDAAGIAGVDYIGVGPVHATPTKPGRPAVGCELVTYAAEHTSLPFFAIGGIEPGNVGKVCAAGASRVAVVRALTEAPDPKLAARRLRAAVAGLSREEAVGVRAQS